MDANGLFIAACRHPQREGSWQLYFVNMTADAVDLTIETIGVEWGDIGNVQLEEKHIGTVGAAEFLEVWICDSDAAELNPWLTLRVRRDRNETRLLFELPKLYRIRHLEPVPLVGREGYLCRPSAA